MSDNKQFYSDTVNKNTDCGVEREYVELGKVHGPEPPAWILGETLYELYVRAFTDEGTFKAAKLKLNDLTEMGISVIWLMPIHPIGVASRKGTLGSPYAIKDYFAVNPEYGSEQDFKEFIDEAHKIGMRVIMDLVVNHASVDFVEPDYLEYDSAGNIIQKITDWTDVADLNYDQSQTRNYILSVMQHWITQFNIDGYRCDVSGLVPLDFWEWAIPQLKRDNPELFFLAEWESPFYQEKAFHAYYDWSLFNLLSEINSGQGLVSNLSRWLELKSVMYPQKSLPLRFLENHDKPRAAKSFTGEQIAAMLVFLFTVDGVPLIYNGQEFADKKYSSLFEKEPITYSESKPGVYYLIKQLIELRRKCPAMVSKNYHFIKADDKQKLLVYEKDDKLMVVINLSAEKQAVKSNQYKKQNLLFNTSDQVEINNTALLLLPWQALVFEIKGS